MQRQSTHKFTRIKCIDIIYIQTNCNIVYTVINHPILRMTTTQKVKKIIDDNEKKYLYVVDLT